MRKIFSSPTSVPPTKVTTQAKSFQSAATELKEHFTPNSSTSHGRKDDMDPRVKTHRKRHHNKNNTNCKVDRTTTVKPGTSPVAESKQDGPPSKHRTKVKSSQSGTTAATYVQASTQLIDSRVKIQRKRRNRKDKTNGNAYTTVTTKPMPTQPGRNISYFITKPSIPPPDKDNESMNGESKDEESNTCDICEVSEDEEILLLSGPGFSWYEKTGKNAFANLTRSEERMKSGVVMQDQNMTGLIHGSVTECGLSKCRLSY